jgi:dolichol-phosphate mannosyltransferase
MVIPKTLVVIPTYNESANLMDVVTRIRSAVPNIDILVVDDNSPDGTGDIAEGARNSQTFVLHRTEKNGLGPAYLAGFAWALEQDYAQVVEMDADGSHQPEQLPIMLAAAQESDLVIGTRWMPGGQVVNWPTGRRLISRFGTRYASVLLKLPYTDLTSGYRVLSSDLVKLVLESKLRTLGYGFQIEIVLIAEQNSRRIAQVPITFVERTAGESKMSRAIVFEAWLKTTAWGFQRVIYRR